MKKTFFMITSLVFLIGLITACTGGQTVTLSAADAGRTIDLHRGDILKIDLEGNPTTGYNWLVTAMDGAILEQQGEPGFRADSQLLGAGGMITLTFRAVLAGTTKLQLGYMRSWEKDVAPLQTYEVTIVVK